MIANASEVQLAAIAETVWGTTPSTPAFQILRFTRESLKILRESVVSSEMRADRNVTDQIQVSGGAGGTLGIELSYGTFDAMLESLLQSTWNANVLKNGITKKSFTIEKKVELGTTDQYFHFKGMMADSLRLSIRAKELISGEFSFVGKGGTLTQTAIASSTYVAATTEEVMSASADFASLSVGGVTTLNIQGLDLEIRNSLRPVDVAGSMDRAGIGTGRFEVTGSLDIYFESNAAYDMFLAGNAVALSFILGSTTLKKYQFDIGSLKFSDAEVLAEGADGDMMCRMQFQGIYDADDTATLKITRAVI